MVGRTDLVEADFVASYLACESRAVEDRKLLPRCSIQPDVSRIERLCLLAGREVEDASTFEKEVTELRKPQREAGQVHLPLVALDFGEVRVDAGGRPEARRDAVVDVQAQVVGKRRGVVPRHAARRFGARNVLDVADEGRNSLEAQALRQVS